MNRVEYKYNHMEIAYVALVFAMQKTRTYLVGQTIHVVCRVNPLRNYDVSRLINFENHQMGIAASI